MKIARLLSFAVTLTLASGVARAHDTDIYTNSVSSVGSKPLIMFYLDMRSDLMASGSACTNNATYCTQLYNAGWLDVAVSSAKNVDVYRAVLKKVMTPLVTATDADAKYKMGLMLNHNTDGGMITMGFANATTANLPVFLEKLKAMPTKSSGSIAHPYQPTEMFFEFFRYLTGGSVQTGTGAAYASKDFCTTSSAPANKNCDSTFNVDNASHYVNLATQWGGATGSYLVSNLSWDPAIINASSKYITPIESACQKIYVLSFTKGVDNGDSDQDTNIKAQYTSGGMANSTVSRTVTYTNTNRFDTVLQLLFNAKLADGTWNPALYYAGADNSVTSYFFVSGSAPAADGWAKSGSGGLNKAAYQLDDPAKVETDITNTLSQILSVSTSFVAPSVAVNVYNRAQVLADVYIAMFQVVKQTTWPGNVKKLQIGKDSAGNLQLQDVNGNNAVGSDGRVAYSAVSYWTDTASIPALGSYPHDANDQSGKDGRNVRLGGSGCRIPGYVTGTPGLTNNSGATTPSSTRIVYTVPATYTNGTATAPRALEATTTVATAMASYFNPTTPPPTGTCATSETTGTSCNYIKYIRGLYYNDAERDYTTVNPSNTTITGDWIQGDPLHSRPLAINYGTKTGSSTTHGTKNPNIRLVVGGNDGLLHMFRNTKAGNVDPATTSDWKTPTPTGYQDGVEAWAFMPTEVMSIIPTLRANPNTKHLYGVDGTPVVRVVDTNGDGNLDTSDGDKVYLYFGLRRGGRAYYALDISNPDDPKFLWKIDNTSPGMSQLGQTWSTPKASTMLYDGSTTPRPVLIFAGGYDPNKDDNGIGHTAAAGGNDSYGNAIFIVNADTGAVIWKATKGASNAYVPPSGSEPATYTRTDMLDSIPSPVTAIDANSNGMVDRIYVGDTGGKLWRVDTLSKDQVNWTVVPLLSVGRHYSAAAADNRRFFSAPDYVQTVDASGVPFDAVILGTGDRENPLGTTVTDWFYMLKDYDVSSGVLTNYGTTGTATQVSTGLTDVSSDCFQVSTGCTAVGHFGWKMKLECPPDKPTTCGEKNLAPAFTLGGVIMFTTYIPTTTSGTCGPSEGIGRLYTVALQDATAVNDYYVANNTSSGTLYYADRSIKLASGGIPSEVVSVGGGNVLAPDLSFKEVHVQSGLKTFWFEQYYP